MSGGPNSDIIIVSTGRLNTVNDTVIAGRPSSAPVPAGVTPPSLISGQLGKHYWLSPENIAQMFDSTVGTLYGGRYRYVRMRADDVDSPAVSVGSILFWDTTLTNWWQYYQVTRDENLSSVDNAVCIAGIYLGGFTGGNYGFIQDLGLVNVRFRSVLTAAGAIGSRVYAAGAGDTGLDQGSADVLTTDSTSLANARFLGIAMDTAPAASTLSRVDLRFTNVLS
jgi:hypothetical protein